MTLRSRRLYLGYTLQEVAREAGIQLMTLQRIETGQTQGKPETLHRIRLALNRLARRKRRPPREPKVRKARDRYDGTWPKCAGGLTKAQLDRAEGEALLAARAWEQQIRKRLSDGPSTPSELARRTGIDKREVQACLCVLRGKHLAEPCHCKDRDGRETPHWRLVGWVDEPIREWPPDVRDARGVGR